jgi:hypothetical protein
MLLNTITIYKAIKQIDLIVKTQKILGITTQQLHCARVCQLVCGAEEGEGVVSKGTFNKNGGWF